MPEGMHVVCGDSSYYSNGYGRYLVNQGVTSTYVLIDGIYYKLDMPNIITFPTYDIDVFEDYLFENNYRKSIVSVRYKYNQDDLFIALKSLDEPLVYEISLPEEDMIFRFNNQVEDTHCDGSLSVDETISLKEYIENFLEQERWEDALTIDALEDVSYHSENNTITMVIEDGSVMFHLSLHEVEFALDGVAPYSYHLDKLQFSWNEGTSTGKVPPESIIDLIDYHDYYVFIDLYREYQATFYGEEYYIE